MKPKNNGVKRNFPRNFPVNPNSKGTAAYVQCRTEAKQKADTGVPAPGNEVIDGKPTAKRDWPRSASDLEEKIPTPASGG